ncbi:hypothetical protein RFI_10847, partial [Reticulomyxa filosa]
MQVVAIISESMSILFSTGPGSEQNLTYPCLWLNIMLSISSYLFILLCSAYILCGTHGSMEAMRRRSKAHERRRMSDTEPQRPAVLEIDPPLSSATFQCFNQSFLENIFTKYNRTERTKQQSYEKKNLLIFFNEIFWGGGGKKKDDWSPANWIIHFLMKELFGFNATLHSFYADVFWIIDEYEDIVMEFETYYNDFDPEVWLHFTVDNSIAGYAPLGTTAMTYWTLHQDVYSIIQQALGNSTRFVVY